MSPKTALILWAAFVQVTLIAGSLLRKNVDTLTDPEVLSLQSFLRQLSDDDSASGFQTLASFHGEPSLCLHNDQPIACCIHGEATFPHWHRLYTVQFEQLLAAKGLANIGVPYWDWTQPLTELPKLVENLIFKDPNGGLGQKNAWFSGQINIGDLHTETARAVDERLFEHVEAGGQSKLFNIILDALEHDDYCQFEVQLEVAHNHMHYLVGGRHLYSMSTLEYTSYDPIFFLHHANVDRIFAIWQELQKKRGKSYDHSDCNVELFNKPLEPFFRDVNTVELTKTFNKPKDLFSYLQLGYTYDDLNLNGMNIDQLHSFLEQRQAREREFAVFSLHGVGFSANVRVQVCNLHGEVTTNCEFAGDFFILGGANEMPWEFNHPYYFDITDAVSRLGEDLDGHYAIRADVYSVNGTNLGSNVLPKPWGSHRPARGHTDPVIEPLSKKADLVVRKNVNVLTDKEVYALRQAMARFQNDTSIDGFQAVAEFHGLPAKCPHPDAAVRYACCIHGMPTFPHWHRLFVAEVEDELKGRGMQIGMPYWDWSRPNTHMPALANDETYVDPYTHETLHNPWYDADVTFLGQKTTRQVQDDLNETPAFGDHTELFDGMLLAFEQTDFCDFEVQFEVVHNAIHFLVGGFSPYSMTTLHYSAFDPIFYLHHSNVDRLWAIWQELQMHRGLPYKAHCANTMTQELMKPFGFPPPWHNDPKTFNNARPTNIYDYERALDYTYDSLQFGGMTIEQLDHYIEELKTRDRTFVGILLHGIGSSAWATISISVKGGEPYTVGRMGVLGGEKEMPWRFDRVFKMEITDALSKLGLRYDDDFEVHMAIKDMEGNDLSEDTYSHHDIIHVPGQVHDHGVLKKKELVRRNVNSLTAEQVQNIRDALRALKEDTSVSGFNQIAAFHGQPNWCPRPDAENKLACCAHGMAVFPHWHRLLTVQAENALVANGLTFGLPYWDWTLPISDLPDLVKDENYVHPGTGHSASNPFYSHTVDGHTITRDVNADTLFYDPGFGKLTDLADKMMLAFEQTDFCDFEVQFEIVHNDIHILVGGNNVYSMASLRYTAYDPIFYLHHSNTDRMWAIWQALQKYRGLPYNSANCALASLRQPMQPFAFTSETNPDINTRDHSLPFDVFNYHDSFHYRYDNFQFNGMSVPQLYHEIFKRRARDRVFAGFMLHGIKKSAQVVFDICKPSGECSRAGDFYLLGDEYEIPWEYDRLFKYDITRQLEEFGLQATDRFNIHYVIHDLDGSVVGDDLFGNTTIIHTLGATYLRQNDPSHLKVMHATSHIRRNLNDLTEGEVESLRSALHDMEVDGSFEEIARFHGYPGMCDYKGQPLSCCVHGSPVFMHWHRLYVEQVENVLLAHGSAVAMPYWDWTTPIAKLPAFFHDASYINSRTQKEEPNPFFSWKISGPDVYTARHPMPDLFNNDYFLNGVLLALEQTSFCDFEIQLEMTHNSIHTFLGGRAEYSMSGVDYTAFDPVFFLHHSNVDRIWAVWQALQAHRGLLFDRSDCALNLMGQPLRPFDDSSRNRDPVTRKYSRPVDAFQYSVKFNYHYDSLNFNTWTIPQLEDVLQKQRQRDRVFAGFMLHEIGTSALVDVYLCVPTGKKTKNCDHKAGKFSVLGGKTEMPFQFDRLFRLDISDAVRKLGLRLDSAADFDLKIKLQAINGSYIDPGVLSSPTLLFVPGEGQVQSDVGRTEERLVRKNLLSLSATQRRSLVLALRGLQADHSADGFQSIASFHALPPLCPYPEANERYACCIHGMATFPHWHRLYTVQFEDALRRHGATVGIPYWDTVQPQSTLPAFFTDGVWDDAVLHTNLPNPWAGAPIDFVNAQVGRSFNTEQLSRKGPKGYDTWSWKQYLYALEQENYCDFEVQFEIAHNAIHLWVGGDVTHSMGHLHFASYDPVFFLHHANVDRIFAIWQELQKYRGLNPNQINCAMEMMKTPLKPFSFGKPYNLNPTTKEYSSPQDAFDYRGHFHYEYDTLDLEGMDIRDLQNYINEQKEKDRVFVGFQLTGFGSSATVRFSVCRDSGCIEAGFFDILGGSAEMPWHFDRLYKYEITDVLKDNGIDVRDDFHIELTITAQNGSSLSSSLIPQPSVAFQPKSGSSQLHQVAPNRVRHDLSHLGEREFQSLKSALKDLQEETGPDGYQKIAAFHGAPPQCPSPQAAEHACCVHGMPTFPHWHRLYTVEMEDALIRHGASVAFPYWDWTRPVKRLPELFTAESFYDAWRDQVVINPFARCFIESVNGYTVRDPQPELYKLSNDGEHSVLFDEVLLALEQTDYCDFEVQFEVTHNAIHYLVGGRQRYSLASLEYSSYDPIFFVHHTFVDKIWVVWQELQKRRGLPHDRADCAVNYMHEKLHPFDWEDLNPDVRTREHAMPMTVFDYEDLGYHYDNMEIGGKNIDELEKLIRDRQSQPRVFAGFYLHSIGTSADVIFYACQTDSSCVRAGGIFILGGPTEMAWSFGRLFKYDITETLDDIGIKPEDVFNSQAPFFLKYEVHGINGTALPQSSIASPNLIFEPAQGGAVADSGDHWQAGLGIRKEIGSLTVAETENLRDALRHLQTGTGRFSFNSIVSAHGWPPQCELDGHEVACCHHGMASFPQWHRVFVRHMELALYWEGAEVGIPYWDWTAAFTQLPVLLTQQDNNPFHHGHIPGSNKTTTRAPRSLLFNDPERGDESFFYRQVMLAFEQRDYCDFEVQFEVIHNAIHSWVGGTSPYGMSTLEYTAYDPLFFIHHSNVDRQFAIWQALQKHRGLDYNTANCNIQELRQPLEPFNRDSNPFRVTRSHSRAIDAFNYDQFGYQYDNLNFHGLTIPELEQLLEKKAEEDRVFANFMLRNIYTSADVEFDLCTPDDSCNFAGTFAFLGGPLEMPWSFDRLFKYDVTKVFRQMSLRPDSEYHFRVKLTAVNGTRLDSSLLEAPSVSFVPGRAAGDMTPVATRHPERTESGELTRYEVSSLSLEQVSSLRNALYKLQNDHGPNGFEAIASFHGAPGLCPENATDRYSCCRHGMPIFPHWHRLLTVQFERALKEKGAVVGVPYWDWTRPLKSLPSLFTDPFDNNPFKTYRIGFNNEYVQRDVSDELFRPPSGDDMDDLFSLSLLTLEETNYCDFEVQYEMLHNAVHGLVGGHETHSMSTLGYSAFDPLFMVHHSSVDRLWKIWQTLQKLRHKPFNFARCANRALYKPLEPFSYDTQNHDPVTRSNALPVHLFDTAKFHYHFDNLDLNGHSVTQINEMIERRKANTRFYAGFVLSGIGSSANVKVELVQETGEREDVGWFFILGGEKEMPWAYERIYKVDITKAAIRLGMLEKSHAHFTFDLTVTSYDGTKLDVHFPSAVLVKRAANADYDELILPLRQTNDLPPKIVVRRGTRVNFHPVEAGVVDTPVRELGSYTSSKHCAIPPAEANAYDLNVPHALEPGHYYFTSGDKAQCEAGSRIQITVDDD